MEFTLSLYAASQFVCEAVVGMEYPDCNATANVPLVVTGDPDTVNPVGTVMATLVTEPDPVPAPMAVLNVAASNALTELSALMRGNVMADGLVSVKKFWPTVVPPRDVRPVDAVNPVAPPSHFRRSVYAVFQFPDVAM